MLAVIIPAYNEEDTIGQVLDNLKSLPVKWIIPVLNGCSDATLPIVLHHTLIKKVALIHYPLPLGIDIPRAVGAECAIQLGAEEIMFVDGDLSGNFTNCLHQLYQAVHCQQCQLALTNCYPNIGYRSQTAKLVLRYREQLNRTLGLFQDIGLATPSHGPHCLSAALLDIIGTDCLSIPPLLLAKTVESGLKVQVAAALNNEQWHSRQRDNEHNQKIADTIIGDCIEARQYFTKQPITRMDKGIYYFGYRQHQFPNT